LSSAIDGRGVLQPPLSLKSILSPASLFTWPISATVPVAVWRIFTAASWPERMSWLAWVWVGYLAAVVLNRFASRGIRRSIATTAKRRQNGVMRGFDAAADG
jgi:hypothetical protein